MCCRQTSPEAKGGVAHTTGHAACCFCFGPVRMALVFLSTPSAGRATEHSCRGAAMERYFYPRPPRGGRPGTSFFSIMLREFLSTPSARRATWRNHRKGWDRIYFYPRPPRGGRPCCPGVVANSIKYFYPRPPRGGRHAEMRNLRIRTGFLSTPSVRRATNALLHLQSKRPYFYPRPPRGGRQQRGQDR